MGARVSMVHAHMHVYVNVCMNSTVCVCWWKLLRVGKCGSKTKNR